ncbi:UNVERIFIED_CONTAM: hypothetical protein Slati_2946900 [Sesamum latifolium]|uniref:Uncharacterized protein n=1 Tax=Sesamum latifolium TaxID=2727402 RepID=A0AAW2VJ33_9LAMI
MEVLTLILQQFIDQDGGFSYHWRCGEVQLFQLGLLMIAVIQQLTRPLFRFLSEALQCLRTSQDFTLILRRAILFYLVQLPLIGIYSYLFWDIRKGTFPSGI